MNYSIFSHTWIFPLVLCCEYDRLSYKIDTALHWNIKVGCYYSSVSMMVIRVVASTKLSKRILKTQFIMRTFFVLVLYWYTVVYYSTFVLRIVSKVPNVSTMVIYYCTLIYTCYCTSPSRIWWVTLQEYIAWMKPLAIFYSESCNLLHTWQWIPQ